MPVFAAQPPIFRVSRSRKCGQELVLPFSGAVACRLSRRIVVPRQHAIPCLKPKRRGLGLFGLAPRFARRLAADGCMRADVVVEETKLVKRRLQGVDVRNDSSPNCRLERSKETFNPAVLPRYEWLASLVPYLQTNQRPTKQPRRKNRSVGLTA